MVYIFLAEGFEEIEALTQIDLLRRAGIEVTPVGIGGVLITGAHGISVNCDVDISDADLSDVDMLILPGGIPGVNNLYDNEILRDLIVSEVKRNTWIAAICAAPIILGRLGLAVDTRMVCYPGFEDELKGAIISKESVVVDKNFITSKAAGVSIDFAYELISALKGRETAEKVVNGIYYER